MKKKIKIPGADMEGIFFFILVGAGVLSLRIYGIRMSRHDHYTSLCTPPETEPDDLVFTGEELALYSHDIHDILIKRFPYYRLLEPALQARFVRRMKIFMRKKTFIIKDKNGVREMPVLVSASAVQLGFGLKHYRLPFYKYIRIYPSEYWSQTSFFTILAGNVEQNIISIAWNHVLDGYANSSDGVNTALHEMAHALYIQKMVIDEEYAEKFNGLYQQLLKEIRTAHHLETTGRRNLFSEYAESSMQEFWAESVELFFEKPEIFARHYLLVYETMSLLLNQDPRNGLHPLLHSHLSMKKRFRKVRNMIMHRVGMAS